MAMLNQMAMAYGNAIWQSHMGKAIWQGHMARPYGNAIWQSHMARPYGFAIWQGHMAMPYGSRGLAMQWRAETFFRNFTLEKTNIKKLRCASEQGEGALRGL